MQKVIQKALILFMSNYKNLQLIDKWWRLLLSVFSGNFFRIPGICNKLGWVKINKRNILELSERHQNRRSH